MTPVQEHDAHNPSRPSRGRVLKLSRRDVQLLQACLRFQARQQHDREIRGRLLRLSNELALIAAAA
jgi:hypothetical protein